MHIPRKLAATVATAVALTATGSLAAFAIEAVVDQVVTDPGDEAPLVAGDTTSGAQPADDTDGTNDGTPTDDSTPTDPEDTADEVLTDTVDGDEPTVEGDELTNTVEGDELTDTVDAGDLTDTVDEGDEDLVDDEPRNHGEVVSDFARTTELEGCERGHAVSAVARGLDPSEAKPCDDEEDDSTSLVTDASDDVEDTAEADESSDVDTTEDTADEPEDGVDEPEAEEEDSSDEVDEADEAEEDDASVEVDAADAGSEDDHPGRGHGKANGRNR